MAILKIVRMGHQALRQPAAAITDPDAPEIRQLIADMIETLDASGGIGLAATQVGVPLQLVMFFVPARRMAVPGERDGIPLTILINPTITPLSDEQVEDWEACLSVPGLTGRVPRYRHIRYQGLTPEGEMLSREALDFHARVVQHEVDHLYGYVYPMRMNDLSLLMFHEEAQQYVGPKVTLERD